jgi:hypothetical protein
MRTGTHERFIRMTARHATHGSAGTPISCGANSRRNSQRVVRRTSMRKKLANEILGQYVDGLQQRERLEKLGRELDWSKIDAPTTARIASAK